MRTHFERLTLNGRVKWAVALSMATVLVAAVSHGAFVLRTLTRELADAAHSGSSSSLREMAAQSARRERGTDFVATLSAEPPVDAVLMQLNSAVLESGLQLATVRLERRASSETLLGRATLDFEASGRYPNHMDALGTTLERSAGLTVSRIHIRADRAGNTNVQFRGTLHIWGAPLSTRALPAPR